MPDVFGRTPQSYRHFDALIAQKCLDEYLEGRAQRASERIGIAVPRHDLNVRVTRSAEGNAQVLAWATNSIEAIQSMIDEVFYTEDRTAEMVPIESNIAEGAQTYAYRVVDRVGKGRFIEYDGTSAPSASVGVRLVPYQIAYAGIIASWTLQDLRAAMMTGVALDSETIMAATTGARDHIETVAFTGDDERGFKGLINQPTATSNKNRVTHVNATAAHTAEGKSVGGDESLISKLTPDEMVAFLQRYTTQVITSTKEVFGRTIMGDLCIYMPIAQAATLNETRLPDTGMNVWQYFAQNNSWSSYTGRAPTLKWLAELGEVTATVNNAADTRAIWAVKSKQVMEMAIPIMPRVITVLNEGYRICAPLEYRLSGLNVKRPRSIIYVDGV